MTPQPLRVGVMDSAKPGRVETVPVLALSTSARVVRSLQRLVLVSGVGLLVLPVPLLHACGAAIALVAGPVAAALAFRAQALVGAAEIGCPKCGEAVAVPARLAGWPARLQCLRCKAMLELTPVEESAP